MFVSQNAGMLHVRDFENQSRLAPVDLGLKPALVEGFAQRVHAAAVTPEGDEAGASLKMCLLAWVLAGER